MRLYLAFKMRGEPQCNFPWSHEVAWALRRQGYEVFNPAEFDEANGFDPSSSEVAPLAFYMEHDLAEVCKADGIALGRNWRTSVGACLEALTAAVLGKRTFEVVEHRGSVRHENELSVELRRVERPVVMALAYQTLLPEVVR